MKGIDRDGLHLSSRERWLALLGRIAIVVCGVWFVRFCFTISVLPGRERMIVILAIGIVLIIASVISYYYRKA